VGKPGGCHGRPIVAGSSCEHVRNVSLEHLNRVFLVGDDPLDRVTDGDHANDFGLLEHGEMGGMALGHPFQCIRLLCAGGGGNRWAGHDIVGLSVFE
jgi:hypothetical protein